MKRVQSDDPERVVFADGTGLAYGLGLPFAIMGLAVLALCAFGGGEGSRLLRVLGGAVFVALGLALVTGTSGFELNLRARTYRSWWGVFAYRRERKGAWGAGAHVRIEPYPRSKAFPFSVTIAPGGGASLHASQHRSFEEARAAALSLARELRLRIGDATLGSDVLVEPDELERPLQARLADGRAVVPSLREPPPSLQPRIEVEPGRGTLRIRVPCPGLRGREPWTVLAALALTLGALWGCASWIEPAGGRLGFRSFVVALGSLMALIVLQAHVARATIIVDGARLGLRIEGLWRWTTSLPLAAIHDVTLAGESIDPHSMGAFRQRGAVVVRAPGKSIAFGAHLPREEKEWIRDALVARLGAG